MRRTANAVNTNADIVATRKPAERVMVTLGERSKVIRALAVATIRLCREVEELREKTR